MMDTTSTPKSLEYTMLTSCTSLMCMKLADSNSFLSDGMNRFKFPHGIPILCAEFASSLWKTRTRLVSLTQGWFLECVTLSRLFLKASAIQVKAGFLLLLETSTIGTSTMLTGEWPQITWWGWSLIRLLQLRWSWHPHALSLWAWGGSRIFSWSRGHGDNSTDAM